MFSKDLFPVFPSNFALPLQVGNETRLNLPASQAGWCRSDVCRSPHCQMVDTVPNCQPSRSSPVPIWAWPLPSSAALQSPPGWDRIASDSYCVRQRRNSRLDQHCRAWSSAGWAGSCNVRGDLGPGTQMQWAGAQREGVVRHQVQGKGASACSRPLFVHILCTKSFWWQCQTQKLDAGFDSNWTRSSRLANSIKTNGCFKTWLQNHGYDL